MANLIKATDFSLIAEKMAIVFSTKLNQPKEVGEDLVRSELSSFLSICTQSNLLEVTPETAKEVFRACVQNDLSFSAADPMVYLQSRNVKNATGGWEKRLYFKPTPSGDVFLCQRAGSIDRLTKPVIVYEGDNFQPTIDKDGNTSFEYSPKLPRDPKAKILAGFIYVVFKDGSREGVYMDYNEVERLKGYSAKQNKERGANQLYTSNNGQIDPGFFGAKLIKAALKNKRKTIIHSASFDNNIEELPKPDENAVYQVTSITSPVENVEEPITPF